MDKAQDVIAMNSGDGVAPSRLKSLLILAWLGWLLGLGCSFAILALEDKAGPPPMTAAETPAHPEAVPSLRGPQAWLTPPDVNTLIPSLNQRGQVVVSEASNADPLAAFRPPPDLKAGSGEVSLMPNPEELHKRIAVRQEEMIAAEAFQTALKKYEAALANRKARHRPEEVPEAGWGPLINKYARLHGVEARLVWAVMRHESGFNPNAVSPKGAMGLMQLIPSTAALLGVTDPFNPEENISGGVRYLKFCLDKFNHNVVWALAAYNAGPDNVSKYQGCPPFAETRSYVLRVMRDYTGSWIDLPLPPQGAATARRPGSEPGVQAPTVAASPSGLDWKIPPAAFKVAKPTWKIPLATTILAHRIPLEVRQHPEVGRLLAKHGNRKPTP